MLERTAGGGGGLVVYLDMRAVTLVEELSLQVLLDTEVVDRVLVMIVQTRGQTQHGPRASEVRLKHFSLKSQIVILSSPLSILLC